MALRLLSLLFVVGLFCFLFFSFQYVLAICSHRSRRVVKRKVMMTWVGIIVVVEGNLRGEVLIHVVSREQDLLVTRLRLRYFTFTSHDTWPPSSKHYCYEYSMKCIYSASQMSKPSLTLWPKGCNWFSGWSVPNTRQGMSRIVTFCVGQVEI